MNNKKISLVYFVLSILLTAIALGVIGIFALRFGAFSSVPMAIFYAFLGMFITPLVFVTLHEIGHLLGGKKAKFVFYSFRIGFLKWYRVNDKVKFKFETLKNFGGVCQMVPTNEKTIYRDFYSYVKGGLWGSAFAIIIFAIFTAVWIYFAPQSPVFLIGLIGLPLSIYSLIINCNPAVVNGATTDGGYLRAISRKLPEGQAIVKILLIQTMLICGQSPKEISKDMYFDFPVLADNDVNKIIMDSYRFAYYLDLGQYEKAIEYNDKIEAALDYLPEVYHQMLYCDIFFTTAALKMDFEKARVQFEKIEQYTTKNRSMDTMRIRMAKALFVDNDPNAAMDICLVALKMKDSFYMKGIAKMEENILNDLKEIAINKLAEKALEK